MVDNACYYWGERGRELLGLKAKLLDLLAECGVCSMGG